MENINSVAELKLVIQAKQLEHAIQEQLLKEQFFVTFDSLKPVNLIKSTLSEITSSPYLIDNMVGAVVGMAGGFISKKIAVGRSHNLVRKIMGSVLQFGVTNMVAQHQDVLKSIADLLIHRLFHKKENNPEKT
jgi:hypothetical protein